MKKDLLTLGNVTGLVCGASYVFDLGNTIYLIMAIISLAISIVCGVLKIAATIKKAGEDGKYTSDELKSIADEISGLKNEIEKGVQDNAKSNGEDERSSQRIND